MTDSEDMILVNLTCVHCGKNINAIISRNAFDGPFDDGSGKGTRVQYVEMVCAGCGKKLVTEIPYLTREEERALPIATIKYAGTVYKELPAYIGRSMEEWKD